MRIEHVKALTCCATATRCARGGSIPFALFTGPHPAAHGTAQVREGSEGDARELGVRWRSGRLAVAPYRCARSLFITRSAAHADEEGRGGGTPVPPPLLKAAKTRNRCTCRYASHTWHKTPPLWNRGCGGLNGRYTYKHQGTQHTQQIVINGRS